MTGLLELKERLIRFFGKNEIYVKPVIRFVLALFTFLVINNSIGYMKLVSKCTMTLSVILFHCVSIFSFFCLLITESCLSANSFFLFSSIPKSFTSLTPPTVLPNHPAYFSLSAINSSIIRFRFFAKHFIMTAFTGIKKSTMSVIL